MDIIVFNYFQTIRICPTSSKGLLGHLPCQELMQDTLKFWSAWISLTKPTIYKPKKGFPMCVPVVPSLF